MAASIETYVGVIVVDNNQNRVYLQQQDDQGQPFQTLMMLDPSATGDYDPGQVTAAWSLFSDPAHGLQSGISRIQFQGFWAYPPGSNAPVLHVVS
jgi:hypothetical protein